MSDLLIEMSGIYKQFPNVKAVNNARFDLRKGEIHSLIGENGAGKSTMMKILYGIYEPDEGEIIIKGNVMGTYTPHKAIELGIGMVHQEFMLVKELSVLENIILGFEPKISMGRIDYGAARTKIQTYVDRYSMEIQLNKKVMNIAVGEAQRVEIIKTLYRNADILILDEATAVLTPQESEKLFEILRIIRDQGKSVIFISHKLNEVIKISDRITVMRHGKYVNTVNAKETSVKDLANMMVGRDVILDIKRNISDFGDDILQVKRIFVSGEKELSKLKGVSFSIRKGEVLGVAGVDGNGQSELAEAISGLRHVESGEIVLCGTPITNLTPKKIRSYGIGHIPEDRNLRGLNKEFSIRDNLIAAKIAEKPYSDGWVLHNQEIDKFADDLIGKYDIRPPNKDVLVQTLSGGNSQKIIVAREVDAAEHLLIAAQPTRGVDVGSIESIRAIINRVKMEGLAVLLISADLDEIISLSDRVIVMYEGQITGELVASELSDQNLGILMTGGGKVHEEKIAN